MSGTGPPGGCEKVGCFLSGDPPPVQALIRRREVGGREAWRESGVSGPSPRWFKAEQ